MTLGLSPQPRARASNSAAVAITVVPLTTGTRSRTHASRFLATTGNVAVAANSATSAAVCGNEDAGAGTSCSRHSSCRPRLFTTGRQAGRHPGQQEPFGQGGGVLRDQDGRLFVGRDRPGRPRDLPPGFCEPLDHPLRIGALLRRPDVVTAAVPGQRRGRPPILRHGVNQHPAGQVTGSRRRPRGAVDSCRPSRSARRHHGPPAEPQRGPGGSSDLSLAGRLPRRPWTVVLSIDFPLSAAVMTGPRIG